MKIQAKPEQLFRFCFFSCFLNECLMNQFNWVNNVPG